MASSDTYIFAGGGSGGHLFPGIAVADELRRRDPSCRIVFIGSERPVERTILEPTGFEHHALPIEPLSALKRSPFRCVRRNWSAWRQATRLVKSQRPRWVIGLGGLASVPTVWAARRFGIPILLIEQNVIPGAATRWLAGSAKQLCLSFEETRGRLRSLPSLTITGNPVRQSLLEIAARRTAASDRRATLLILGGSQGAESLNDAVLQLLPNLRDVLLNWRIVHQTGSGRADAVRQAYRQYGLSAIVEDFFPNLAAWYAKTDLAISRAGATTLAELACVGCPAVLVPYPFAADQHQAANAEVFARRGAAVSIAQAATAEETAQRLHDPLVQLLTDSPYRTAMGQAMLNIARPDAARTIADLLAPSDAACRVPNRPHTMSADYAGQLAPHITSRDYCRETD